MRSDGGWVVPPVVVIGVSGATWDVIDPLLAAGRMPHLADLVARGTRGVLTSVRTPGDRHFRPQVAWPSVLTGMRPEHHGLQDWYGTFDDLEVDGIWDHFERAGRRVGIYSTPVFWPPPHVDGFVVPAPHGRDARAWPPDLDAVMGYYRHHQDSKLENPLLGTVRRSVRFLPVLFGPGQDPRPGARLVARAARVPFARDAETRALVLRHAKLDFSTAVFLWLLRRHRPGFAVFTSFEADYVSHRYWRYRDPGRFPDTPSDPPRALAGAVDDIYVATDRAIGSIVRALPPDAVVAVVSEHGMAAEPRSNEIGRWQYMIDPGRLAELAGLGPELVPAPVARWIAVRRRDGGAVDPAVALRLRGIRLRSTGASLFRVIEHHADEVVVKVDVQRDRHPDVADLGPELVEVPGHGTMPLSSVLRRVGPTRSAMHTEAAVLVLAGPGIRAGRRVTGGSVLDVAPTLLRAARMPVPDGLDGAVLDVFS